MRALRTFLLTLALLAALTPGPARAEGKATKTVNLLHESKEIGDAVLRLTYWCQAWIRAVESPPTKSTRSLDDDKLEMLGKDLQARMEKLQGRIRGLETTWEHAALSKKVDRAKQIQNLQRMRRSIEKLKVLPRTFLLKLQKR